VPAILDKLLRIGEGKILRQLEAVTAAVNAIEDDFVAMSDDELRGMTAEFKERLANGESAYQSSGALGSSFQIVATARPGHTAAEMQKVIDEEIEKVKGQAPEAREVQRALNQTEASFYRRMERVGGFYGKADQLNAYYAAGGDPDFFAEDLARYTSISPSDVQSVALEFLPADRRVELVVEPEAAK